MSAFPEWFPVDDVDVGGDAHACGHVDVAHAYVLNCDVGGGVVVVADDDVVDDDVVDVAVVADVVVVGECSVLLLLL